MNTVPRSSKDSRRSSTRRRRTKRLAIETLETRRVFTVLPFGAFPEDTGEFMLGKVAVTAVLLESNGQTDPNTENWTPGHIQTVLQNIETGMNWWVETLANYSSSSYLEFQIDTTYATTPVATRFEPISRRSDDFSLWVNEFLTGVGFSGETQSAMRRFNHSQREKLGTDWSFTIFVVNSQNDADGMFAPGGSFSRAFAFAGGLFQVIPSTRPASTYAHETGHMFWARDEYIGGGSFTDRRGYYGSANTNAVDNPAGGHQPSIMAAGNSLQESYDNHVLPASTRAMIGWQDTDGDGVFDVLDVPLTLTGSGFLDSVGAYRFQGLAKVETLPNLNTEGFKNDITLNRIREVEYRFDGGSWEIISQPNQHAATLDLTIPVPANATTIEIRARDSRTTVTSNVFTGRLARADATPVQGVNGYVWIDGNKNGLRDVQEYGVAGWTVNVLSSSGQPLTLRNTVEPDNLPDGQLASNFNPLFTINAVGTDTDGRVGVFSDTVNSTGTKNFRAWSRGAQSYLSIWTATTRRLQVSFTTPTTEVEIDAIGAALSSYGRLEAYNSAGQLLARYTTAELASGAIETMKISRGSADIAYIIASGHTKGSVRLDNLRFGAQTQTVTGPQGQFAFPSLPAGSYQVQVVSPDHTPTSPSNGRQSVTVAANSAIADIDFAFTTQTSEWQNPNNRLDVNDSGTISPIDALQVINELRRGSRTLAGTNFVPPPFIDVNGDGNLSPVDALLVINFLRARASGEGEFTSGLVEAVGRGNEPSDVEGGTLTGAGEFVGGDFRASNDTDRNSSRQAVLHFGFGCFALEKQAGQEEDEEEDAHDMATWLALNRFR